MNYRHAYHAGNFGDVVKHAVLALLIERLKEKPAPFAVLDSHAGVGRYDLAGPEASKTGEWRHGIARIIDDPSPLLAPYLDAVRRAGWPQRYPGSPRLARALLRPHDRLVLCELHPIDAAALKREFRGDAQVAVHHRDAWEALGALLPPKQRRGLVLVDPAFEATDEQARLVAALKAAHRRWPSGVYAAWYPIKHRAPADALLGEMAASGIRRQLALELTVHDTLPAERLNGCGMLLLNPPWELDATMAEVLPLLQRGLSQSGGATRCEWLVGE